MKTVVLLVTTLLLWASLSAQGWRKGEMQLKIFLEKQEDVLVLNDLRLNMDFIAPEYKAVRAYLVPSELEKVKRLGFDFEIEIEDLIAYSENFWLQEDQYHTYQQIVDVADSLVLHFPDICKKYFFGYSLGNRECFAVKISDNVDIDEPEPEVLFDSGIHGDEMIAAEIVIRFARDIVLAYGSDPNITNLINSREIWLYFMVNPDGRVNNSRYNNAGVDLNRDAPFMWDSWGGSNGACSQPESKYLRECMYNNQFVVHTTYHSGIVFLSCPWSYRPPYAPDWSHIQSLGDQYASSSGYSNLPVEPGFNGMYAINGSTKDSNYGIMGSISWSMEISEIKTPPTSQIMMYYNYNYDAMLAMIEHAGYGLNGVVTDALSGAPVAAVVFVDNGYPCFSDPTAGDYHKYLVPGTYSVKVVANGYASQTVQNVQVNALDATTLDVQLQPEEGQYVYRFAASQIPGNNHQDPGNTKAVIGEPDGVFYSIGKNGWCVLDMQVAVVDGPGFDIRVHEGDATPEGFTCYAGATIDGPWISLGTGTGTTDFDLAVSGLPEAQFIKILDDGDGPQNAAGAGFDLDAIEVLIPISGVYIALYEYLVDDSGGNNNGKIDPGETVDILVTLKNNGDVTAENVEGVISSQSTFITVINGTANFGDLQQGESAQAAFTITADNSTPNGQNLTIQLDIESNNSAYTNSFQMAFVIGQIPVLVIDMDGNNNSAPFILDAVQENGVSAEMVTGFPADLNIFASVFVCLGVYSDNHALTQSEGQLLASYLNNGGNLYMEGGDTWYYDTQTAVHPMFNINPTGDGSSDLSTINGQTGAFTAEMSFTYSGDNNWIDRIEPVSPAVKILQNQSPAYGTGIANEAAGYRTIGCSHEFGGLNDGSAPSTKTGLMEQYLIFFGVMPEGVQAGFTAGQTDICTGETVQFTDNSFGSVTSWNWEFQGGDPATSTQQNPLVAYQTAGSFDVILTVSDGVSTHTVTKSDYIEVADVPVAPATPEGPTLVLIDITPATEYTTEGSPNAGQYIWDIQPSYMGTITGTGTTAEVTWAATGTAQIRVKASNSCGESNFSETLTVICDFSVGIDQSDALNNSFTILPNPNRGKFNLMVHLPVSDVTVDIYGGKGDLVHSCRYAVPLDGSIKLNELSLQPGLYVVRIRDNDLHAFQKLIIY